MRLRAKAAAVALAALALAPGPRAERSVLVALPVSSPVRLDDLLDEPARAQAAPVASRTSSA